MAYDYDLFIIGGGSGGVRAANRTAALGKRVGIAEESRYGGTCVVRGCVPKKLYVYASTFSEYFEDAAGFGWTVGESSFDWPTLVQRKEAEITRLEGLYKKGLNSNKVELFDSRAKLVGPHEVEIISDGKTVTAERILVAVGGYPVVDKNIPGHEHAIVSDHAFDLEALPQSILIAGGGYIAVEFAGIFAGLGVETTLIYRRDKVLRGFDDDVRDHLMDEYAKRGIRILTHDNIAKIERETDGKKRVSLDSGDQLSVSEVMYAIGRNPATESLGLELAGVETDGNGFITVDEFSKTNVDSIWAVGDVTNRVPLTPVAIHESMCFVSTEYKGVPERPDHALIPTAVFSHPEIGTVGLTEAQAADQFDRVAVYRAQFRPMKHTLSGRDTKMLMKIITDDHSGKVLGVHIVGADAGEMVQTLAIAVKMGAKKSDFDRTMALHPSAAEELVTMYEPSYVLENGNRV